ncbi:MAG: N-acetyltransferase family protein [Candidatus Bathyarchaeia archaeon]
MAVRRARGEDLESINNLTDVMHNYLADLYGLRLSAEELEEEHYDEDELEDVYVAEDAKGGVIGYMSFSLGRDEWAGPHYELEHIVVHEDYRGQGMGRKLFDVLLERARREGVNITTGTLAKNQRALRFYKQLGFKPLSVGLLLDLQKRILNR